MKKLVALIFAVLFVFMLTACGDEKTGDGTVVYSFSGSDAYFNVTNGTIVIEGDKETFSGGDLSITQEDAFDDVTFWRTEFYILKDGESRTVLVSEMLDQTGGSEVSISGDLGKISGCSVTTEGRQFNEEDFENNLYFKFTVTKADGTNSSYTVQMDVEKVN